MYFKDRALTGYALEPVSIFQHKVWGLQMGTEAPGWSNFSVGCFQKPVTNRWRWHAAQVGTAPR